MLGSYKLHICTYKNTHVHVVYSVKAKEINKRYNVVKPPKNDEHKIYI